MDDSTKCIRLEVQFKDGSLLKANGDAAIEIWEWFRACEFMNCNHGAVYRGKPFDFTRAPVDDPKRVGVTSEYVEKQ